MKQYTVKLDATEVRLLKDIVDLAAVRCLETGNDFTGMAICDFVDRKLAKIFEDCDAPEAEDHLASCYARPNNGKLAIIDGVMKCPVCGWVRPTGSWTLSCPKCTKEE